MNIRKLVPLAGAFLLSTSLASAQQTEPSLAEVWAIVQQQQAEIDALKAELAATREGVTATNEKVAETEARIEATGDFVESLVVADTGPRKTSIGGYGELHYNNISSDAGDSDEIAVVTEAFAARGAGDTETHDRLVSDALVRLAAEHELDSIILAQASMSGPVHADPGVPVLKLGPSAFAAAAEILAGE